jgi:hypothetical protein
MESLLFIILLSLNFVGLCLMIGAFLLCKRFPVSLPLIKAGAYLAAGALLGIVVIPGAVPWWDYTALEYWSRVVSALLPVLVVLYFLRSRPSKGCFGQKNQA